MSSENPYRALPSVDELASEFSGRLTWPLLVEAAREALESAREAIDRGLPVDVSAAAADIVRSLERSSGIEVINATGVLLHTNLGRSRWSAKTVARAIEAASNYTNIELDLDSGERSRRGAYVKRLLGGLTGAEDALIVNNNAAGLLLSLAATSAGQSVPVARGELIEIGGSYRLPAVIEASGASLVEVGTTNRTRLADYQTALQLHKCGSLLKVHPSNYRIEGFTSEADVTEMAGLAHESSLPLIYDIGSGLLDANTPWMEGPTPSWLAGEPAARQSLAAGADLVLFSGDKLLGGPQAGVIIGTEEAIRLLRRHPLSRALRVDAVTYAALTATLEAYSDDVDQIPFWHQALLPAESLERRAAELAEAIDGKVAHGESTIGAGSVPGMTIPSLLVVLEGEDHLHECLLAAERPVLARREDGALVIDLRTVDPEHDASVAEAVISCR